MVFYVFSVRLPSANGLISGSPINFANSVLREEAVMVQMNRRLFISQVAMSSGAVALAGYGFCPQPAQAQITTFLSYLISDNPILAVVDLFELIFKPAAPSIADVVSSVNGLAQNLNSHFDDLQRHFRSMLAIALDEFALKQDTIQLAALAYRVNIAVAGGSSDAEIRNLSGAIDDVTSKLGSRGVAGSLIYINAIALQNSVHKMLGSSPQVLLAVNRPHDQTLGKIIYDGTTPGTLETAIQQKRSEMNSTTYGKNFRSLKERIGESYTIGTITRYYESGFVTTGDYIVRYDGYQAGEPVKSFWCGPENAAPSANGYRGRLTRATFTPFNTTDVYPIAVSFNGQVVFPQGWPSSKAAIEQVKEVLRNYTQLYSPAYGQDINSRTNTDFGMTLEHAKLRAYLIDVGLNSVKQIVSSANSRIALS